MTDEEFIDGCPDCGQDTIEQDPDWPDDPDAVFCSNAQCGWMP